MDRDEYERDLARRQAEHLRSIRPDNTYWRPCLHDACSSCVGTGVRRDGSPCVHSISCPCQKCSPHSLSTGGFTCSNVGDPTNWNKDPDTGVAIVRTLNSISILSGKSFEKAYARVSEIESRSELAPVIEFSQAFARYTRKAMDETNYG